MIPRNQLELADVFSECQDIYESDKPQFLLLLENHIDLEVLIPRSFFRNYYSYTGRPRTYPLTAMLWLCSFNVFFPFLRTLFLLYFSTTPDTCASSVVLIRFRMLPKSLGSSRLLRMTSRISLNIWSTLLSRSARRLTLPWPA